MLRHTLLWYDLAHLSTLTARAAARHFIMKVTAVFLLSCGNQVDAPAKCDDLVSRLCSRAIACAQDGTTQPECVSSIKTTLPCAQADDISDGYNACMTEIDTSPCSVLLANNTINLPATCRGSIVFKQ